ncbi:putative pectinesterase/pectinesterase inhibitor 40 [Nicotiana tabacum]|uniref:Pectinesterase/pectinesterase inhibitor 40 n=2 Tax=Nicotiana tabacum TaxID=4097 RepID=A0AC58U9C0_TOBAC|nr:PREDICTED: probable pectinesterase/pectinesterase inhibitor 40 [Nicotiana tabacum]
MEGKEMGIFRIILVMFWWGAGNCMTFSSTVAEDGTGNFTTITDAVNAAPSQSATLFFIHVKAGTYNENVVVPNYKTNICLVGDGMGITIISSNKSGSSVAGTATLGVYGKGFIGMKMTIRNTAGAGAGQSAALTSAAFHGFASYYQCRFESFQDTIFAQVGAQFFRECEVYGTIDFISGDGQAIFQNSVVYARTPVPGQEVTIIAAGLDNITTNPGLILQNCTITPAPDFNKSAVKSYLGRPWKNLGRGVVMSSFIDGFIDPQGWLQKPDVANTYFAEYNNRGPGSNTTGRLNWSKVIDKTEASKFTVRNFLQGDKWIPDIIPYYLDLNDDEDSV